MVQSAKTKPAAVAPVAAPVQPAAAPVATTRTDTKQTTTQAATPAPSQSAPLWPWLLGGLIVLALKLALVERAMLATLDRGTGEWLAGARGLRAGLESQTLGHLQPATLQGERRTARVDAARQWPESV